MKESWLAKIMAAAMILALLPLGTPIQAAPAGFNDPNMQIVWERTDKPVEMFVTSRSYMWGPNTLPGSPSMEPYADSPGGQRAVQYFDKSRMEVNNPNGDRSNLFFITNGLLVREMVSGMRQLGDNQFLLFPQALEAVAGDPATVNGNSPTYATFKPIASLNNDHPSTDKTGQPVTQAIDKAGAISTITSPDPRVVYEYFDPNLKHSIANKFVEFLAQTGPVWVNGAIAQDTVVNGVFLAGLPITDAYWVKAKVAGVEKDVLVQLFERRVLTYTPSNPAGFQVEMGNVGQHYLRWRYGGGPAGEERIAFMSSLAGGNQIFTVRPDGTALKQLTTAGVSNGPRWSPDNRRIVFSSSRDGNNEIYVMNADGSDQRRLTFTPGFSEEFPDWSADGARVFFARAADPGGVPDIWSMTSEGADERQLTNTPDYEWLPRVSPDGKKVAFATNRDANNEVYVMDADGSNPTRLTSRPDTSDGPSDWKGDRILFMSSDLQTVQIWSMDATGASQNKLSGDHDGWGCFSPGGQEIGFVRQMALPQRFNILRMNADGTGQKNVTETIGLFYQAADWSN